MKIKLKKETLALGGLCSSGSHQGFPKALWGKLNNGETIEIDSIPNRVKDQIEEVTTKVKSGGKSSSKKGDK
tara:strand:- start:621 stop:836 length:216 start_codon:yes stop_codon:yes gene_type:complete